MTYEELMQRVEIVAFNNLCIVDFDFETRTLIVEGEDDDIARFFIELEEQGLIKLEG